MSMRPSPIEPVPEETARIARAAFRKGNLLMRIRDEIGVLYEDQMFASLYDVRGQLAIAPWRLALVTVFQFLENLSDRQAAEAVRGRIDLKYALSLDLEDAGFDFSVLCEFRARLLAGERKSQNPRPQGPGSRRTSGQSDRAPPRPPAGRTGSRGTETP